MSVTINGSNTPTAGGVTYGDGTQYATTSAGSAGGVLYSAGSSAPAFTAAGTSGQVLTSAGASAPTWTTPSSGALILLATLTPTAAANVDFLSTFTSSYDNYLIVAQGLLPELSGGATTLRYRFANAGTVDTSASYYNTTIPSSGSSGGTSGQACGNTLDVTNSGIGVNFTITVSNTNSATQIKSGLAFATSYSNSTPQYTSAAISLGYPGVAVSGVRLYWNNGVNFVAQGKVRVYGYSNS